MSQKSLSPQITKPETARNASEVSSPDVALPESNSAENTRLGMAPPSEDFSGMELLFGVVGGMPVSAAVELAKAYPEAIPELASFGGQAIAGADPEFAWSLVDRLLAPGTGLGVTALVQADLEGVPLGAEASADLMRETQESFGLEARRCGRIQLGDEGLRTGFEVEHTVSSRVPLEPGLVLELLGVGALLGSSVPPEALGRLVRLIDDESGAFQESLEVRTLAEVESESTLLDVAAEPTFLFGSVIGEHLDGIGLIAGVSADLGLEQRVHMGTDGSWQEVEVSGGVDFSAGPYGLDALGPLSDALAVYGMGATAVVQLGQENTEDGPVFKTGEVRVEVRETASPRCEESTEMVFSSLLEAVLSLGQRGSVTSADVALEQSGLVSLSRSVRVELQAGEEAEQAPAVLDVLADVLPEQGPVQGHRELAIEASSRVLAADLIPLMAGVELPRDMDFNDGAVLVMESVLDVLRGQEVPDWMHGIDRARLVEGATIESPRLVGEVRFTASSGMAEQFGGASGEVRRLIDTPYEGELEVPVWV